MTDVIPCPGKGGTPMATNDKTRERDLRIPTTPEKLAKAVLKSLPKR